MLDLFIQPEMFTLKHLGTLECWSATASHDIVNFLEGKALGASTKTSVFM